MMNLSDRHPGTQAIAKHFAYAHLPDHLAPFSKVCHDVADLMIRELPDSPELTVGLRKLLEAKDCFVRAAVDDLIP